MRIGSGSNTYEWLDNWAQVPNREGARVGWAHHGLAITESGEVVAFHPSDPSVLVFDRDCSRVAHWWEIYQAGQVLTGKPKRREAKVLRLPGAGRRCGHRRWTGQKPRGVDSRLLISNSTLTNPPRSCPVTHRLPMLGDDWHSQYLGLDDAHIPGLR